MNKLKLLLILLFTVILVSACRDHGRHIPEMTISGSEGIVTNWVVVSNPDYGDLWEPGSEHLIKWKTNTEIEKINIDLYKKGSQIYNLELSIDNTGSYIWKIPKDIIQSNHYQVRISNYENGNHEGFSEVFYIKVKK